MSGDGAREAALAAASDDAEAGDDERGWQLEQLPERLRTVVVPNRN